MTKAESWKGKCLCSYVLLFVDEMCLVMEISALFAESFI